MLFRSILEGEDKHRFITFEQALTHARRALELAPGSVDARYWIAAAAGRRAHRTEPTYSTRLAREVYEQATAILAVDSLHAGAHHALGMVHAEAMRAPAWVRFIATRVLRMDLARVANWADAERHLSRAVQLDTAMILYAVDLIDVYGSLGRVARRDSLVTRLRTLPLRHPADSLLRLRSLKSLK